MVARNKKRGGLRLAIIGVLTLFFVAVFTALGVWQLQRLQWKLALIARVDARVHADPQALPPVSDWPKVNQTDDEYLRVDVRGHFLKDHNALVYASTGLGPGYWVLTPLQREDGSIVYINRGYIPLEMKAHPPASPDGEVEVTGLLRLNEPGGTLMRSNVPEDDRWYSRDVEAMAKRQGVAGEAPFFIDAEASADQNAWPRGGLTVIHFRNTHLSYAITWFVMALLSFGGGWVLWRWGKKGRMSDVAP